MGDATGMDLKQLNFYGRENELNRLGRALMEASERRVLVSGIDAEAEFDRGGCNVALIHGNSGTGKSTLVRKFRQENEHKACFIQGKFHYYLESEPYAAFASAFKDLSEYILSHQNYQDIVKGLEESMTRDEQIMLVKAVQPLSALFPECTAGDLQTSYSTNAFYRFQHVVRAFLRSVCASIGTVVMVLDDLHWADEASLELIHGLVNDSEMGKFLFVGTYRDNRLDDGRPSPLPMFLATISSEALQMHDIDLKCFDKETIQQLVVDLLEHPDEDEVTTLTNLVYARSQGNILFVVHYLRLLQQQGFISYSGDEERWIWNKKSARAKATTPSDIIEVIEKEMAHLRDKVRFALMLASCLDNNFRVDVLDEVINALDDIDNSTARSSSATIASSSSRQLNTLFNDAVLTLGRSRRDESIDALDDLLQQAVEAGFIEKKGAYLYQFDHDKIQQAAHSMIDEYRDTKDTQLKVGRILYEMSTRETSEPWMLLTAVNQLNLGAESLKNMAVRRQIAALNKKAADQVKVSSAFTSAVEYLRQGLAMLGSTRWETDYSLCLEMSTSMAEMSYTCCDFVTCKHLIDDVVKHAQTIDDKLEVYHILVQSLGSQGRVDEALNIGTEVLAVLGERIRRGKWRLLLNIFMLRSKLSKKDLEAQLANAPKMTDRLKLQAARLLKILSLLAWMTDRDETLLHIQCRLVWLSLKYGASEFSPFAFSSMGTVLCAIGEVDAGYRVGAASLKLAQKFHRRGCDALAVTAFHFTVNHWRRPLRESLEPLLQGYQAAMDTGEVENACYCATSYLVISFLAGFPLFPLILEGRRLLQHFQDYNLDKAPLAYSAAIFVQFFLNLAGESRNPQVLSGEAVESEDRFVQKCKATNNFRALQTYGFHAMVLCYHFGNLDRAHEMSMVYGKVEWWKEGPHVGLAVRAFYNCLIAIERHRLGVGTKRKNIRQAKKSIKYLQRFVNLGDGSATHMLLVAKADTASLNTSDRSTVLGEYDGAVAACANGDFTHAQAVANERAALYCLECGDTPTACEYMVAAKGLYSKWGATAKVTYLQTKLPFLFYDQATAVSDGSTGQRKQQRLSLA